jgi:hypothetical protein
MAGLDSMAAQGAPMMGGGAPPPPPGDMGGPPPPEEMAQEGQAAPSSPLAPDEELDADIAFGILGNLIYEDQATKIIMDALTNAQNPAPIIASMISKSIDTTAKKLADKGMELSPNVWLAEGGATDRLLDEIAELAEKGGVQFNDQLQSMVFGEVLDQLKIAAQADKKGQGGASPPPNMGTMPPEMGMGAPPPAPTMGGPV